MKLGHYNKRKIGRMKFPCVLASHLSPRQHAGARAALFLCVREITLVCWGWMFKLYFFLTECLLMSLAFKWLKQAFEVNTPLRWMGVIHTSAGAVLFQSGCGENKTAVGWFTVWRPFKHPRSGNLCCFFPFPSRSRIWKSAQSRCRTEVLKVLCIPPLGEIPNGIWWVATYQVTPASLALLLYSSVSSYLGAFYLFIF